FWDKDTLLASNLELAGLHVMNGSRCIGICDDKSLTHIELCRARIPSPRTSVLPLTFSETDLTRTVESLESSFGYPMVVKDCHGSFGEQVRMVSNHDELLLEISDTRVPTIVQEFVPTGGRDVRVEVVGGEPIAAMERKAPEGDFRSNVTIGGSMKAVNPSGDVEELAIRAAECVGAGFCGVDILYSPSGPTVCEVNSNAHIRNITDCTGIRVADLIRDHVVSECKR
ncbi:MAG: RimK family alpha-L-glutamate ligase, partial [Candidatus Methanomethylophilaceae archaeon]|nr:RimK family alpha-L-glutamate ligase [Candidatus Methanomethylophilaceae archaeon]